MNYDNGWINSGPEILAIVPEGFNAVLIRHPIGVLVLGAENPATGEVIAWTGPDWKLQQLQPPREAPPAEELKPYFKNVQRKRIC